MRGNPWPLATVPSTRSGRSSPRFRPDVAGASGAEVLERRDLLSALAAHGGAVTIAAAGYGNLASLAASRAAQARVLAALHPTTPLTNRLTGGVPFQPRIPVRPPFTTPLRPTFTTPLRPTLHLPTPQTLLTPRLGLIGRSTPPVPAPRISPTPPATPAPASTGVVISQADADIYVPAGLAAGRRSPLLVVFSPDGNPSGAIRYWQDQANQRGWIIYASREFSDPAISPFGTNVLGDYNQMLARDYTDSNLLATIKAHLDAVAALPAIDPSRIILAGFSGGAFLAHDLNASYPGFAAAVIDNSNGEPLLGEAQRIAQGDPGLFRGVPTASSFAGSRREAIFLVGQDDTTFLPQIQETVPTYQAWGWSSFVQTYPGGHAPAPADLLNQALDWLVSQPGWA